MYQNGMGVKTNLKTALRWYKSSAEQGYIDAQKNIKLLCKRNSWLCR